MVWHKITRKISQLLSLSMLVVITGCPSISPPKSQEEVGSVNVSVTLVAPWEEYVGTLTPNFTLSATDAVNKVIPRTGILEEKILDALGVSARVGFPQTSESFTKAINAKTIKTDSEQTKETTTTTEDTSVKKEPGKLPDAPSKAQGADKGVKDLPGAPADSGKGLHNDPMLEYTAATALYQEVQLLNRYVTDAALRHGMDAYIVRLQIGIVPFRRNLGYDFYTKIGFFPKTATHEHKEAYVLPLLVTDNLEGALASRAQDTIRQLSLAVSFMKAGIVGTVGGDRLKEVLESEMFTEVNSLFTIGRVTNNTLAARFGALRQGKSSYSVLPRTHNVTVVVMVPNDFVGKENNEVRVVARTSMRSTTDGTVLPQQGRDDRRHHVGEIIKTFLSNKAQIDSVDMTNCEDPDSDIKEDPDGKNPLQNPVPCTQAILQTIWGNSFVKFENALKRAKWYPEVGRGRFARDLWMDIVDSLDRSQYSGVRFELPKKTKTASLPSKDQPILLLDDGKSQMRTTLMGGVGLAPNQLRAILHLNLENGETVPWVGAATVESGGRDLVLTFPSPALWKLTNLNFNKTELELEQRSPDRWGDGGSQTEHYKIVRYRKPNDPIKPAFTITKTVDLIRSDTSYHGSVSLFVEFVKDDKKVPLAKQIEIRVEGADLVQAQFTKKGEVRTPVTPELGKVILVGDGTLDLQFHNLDKSKKVIIKSFAKGIDDKPIGGEHSDVTFDVSEVAPK